MTKTLKRKSEIMEKLFHFTDSKSSESYFIILHFDRSKYSEENSQFLLCLILSLNRYKNKFFKDICI